MNAWKERGIAGILFGATALLLLSQLDMGYSRDESYYFRYARSYAGWFEALESASTAEEVRRVLSRDEVVATWKGNLEHPPLMKSAFGASWRHLATKYRSLSVHAGRGASAGSVALRVGGLGAADGFPVGAEVALLAPVEVGGALQDPGRTLGMARVTDRSRRSALLEPLGASGSVIEACGRRPGDGLAPPLLVGCQAREERPLAVLSEATAMRLPGVLAGALAVMLTFLLGAATVGWQGGLLGALAFLFVPRHFYHAQLCAFDMAIVAGVTATLYGFWRSLEDRRWALVTAVLWGIAILVKHNALFLPVPLVLYWLWTGRGQLRWGRNGWGLPTVPLALWVMPAVGVAMLFVFWPKLWYDPIDSLWTYLSFHLQHDHYAQWYFGEPLEVPPFPVTFPFVLTALTMPESFLLLIVGGTVWRLVRRGDLERDRNATTFLTLNGLLPILLIALPATPIFGGVKHWMTGMPCLLILGGDALATLLRSIASALAPRMARFAIVALAVVAIYLPPAMASVDASVFGTGYYNPIFSGGVQGAADKQLMRVYWGHTTHEALGWLNENAPPRARVFFQNTTADAVQMYRREGLLRADIRHHRRVEGAQIALIEPQKAFDELDIRVREVLGVSAAEVVLTWRGVPSLRIYRVPAGAP